MVAFITANLSLPLASKAVQFANALSTGLLGRGVDAKSAASTLTSLVMNALTHGSIFLIFIGLGMAVVLVALLVGYVIRVALTIILIAGAPLALMCHSLPQTEGIARWWWRAITGVLMIQVVQSLTLVAAMNVFLAKGGFTFFGPTGDGLVNLIVTIALLYILYKIPFWILQSVQFGGGRSMIGGMVKGLIAYKTLGLLGLRGGAATGTARHGGGQAGSGGNSGPGPGPGGPRPRPRPGGPSQPVRAGHAQLRSVRPVRSATLGRATPRPVADPAAWSDAQAVTDGTPGERHSSRDSNPTPEERAYRPQRDIGRQVADEPLVQPAAPPRLSEPARLRGTPVAIPTARLRRMAAATPGSRPAAVVRPPLDLRGYPQPRPPHIPPRLLLGAHSASQQPRESGGR